MSDVYLYNCLPDSVNELLKIKDDLTKERDEKLSDIAKVGFFSSFQTYYVCFSFVVPFSNLCDFDCGSLKLVLVERRTVQCNYETTES